MHRYFRGHGDYCGGRHARRHGFGGLFGGVVGGRGFGWHGFRAGRKLGGDDLQLRRARAACRQALSRLRNHESAGGTLRRLLQPEPGHGLSGADLPRGNRLCLGEAEGAKKLYRITDEGRAYLEQNRRVVDAILAQLAWVGAKMEHVRRVFAGDEASAGGGRGAAARLERRTERRAPCAQGALAAIIDASAEEQRRVADILERAAREIRGK